MYQISEFESDADHLIVLRMLQACKDESRRLFCCKDAPCYVFVEGDQHTIHASVIFHSSRWEYCCCRFALLRSLDDEEEGRLKEYVGQSFWVTGK